LNLDDDTYIEWLGQKYRNVAYSLHLFHSL
jgi:hypothetical protein